MFMSWKYYLACTRREMKYLVLQAAILAGLIGGTLKHGSVANGSETENPSTKLSTVEFEDNFSRFSPGPLSAPLGKIGGAIQEYHYLANRGVDLGPWENVICHIDAWVAGEQDGRTYLEQHLASNHEDMAPKLFAPQFITGDPAWRDYAVEASVCPLSNTGFAGLVCRYHTNRHNILFSIENGKTARLAKRLPLEEKFRTCNWQELGAADFPFEANHYYRLRVENEGPAIRAYIDGKLILQATDDDLVGGKAGVSADTPARFTDFRVTVSPETHERIANDIQQREKDLATLQAENPKPKLWRKFTTPQFGVGRNVRFGDLDGDGEIDMLFGQNVPKVVKDSAVEISCLTAVKLDGTVLWQMGRPDSRNGLLTCDTPFQIHDIDGDGKNDVVICKDFRLQVLDGRTGKLKKSVDLPKLGSYPKVSQSPPRDWPYERANGDSIAFFNFSGDPERREILVKDRYWNFWIFDRDLRQIWSGQGSTGHYPFAYHDPDDNRDLLAIGYSLWDSAGKQRWSNDELLKQHADSVFIGNTSDNKDAPPMVYLCGSDEGIIVLDMRGVIRRQYRVGHAQTACVGNFRPDLPGLEYAAINYWRNPGIVTILNSRGELIQQDEPIHSGSPMLPVNWRGDGSEFILLSGNIAEGGMVDGSLRRAVKFPDDGHPDLCAAVIDLTGDPRDEVVLWDTNGAWIYTQDEPFDKWKARTHVSTKSDQIYAPKRNPHYNDSNYRISESWPAWQEAVDARTAKQ